MAFEPIAIIGMSCVMPGALSPETLWKNSIENKNCLSQSRFEQWGVDPNHYLITEQLKSQFDKLPSITGGYVTGFESVFDPSCYSVDRKQLMSLDVLFQWLLHTAHYALKDARYYENRKQFHIKTIFGNLSYPTASLCELAESIWLSQQKKVHLNDLLQQPNLFNRHMSGYPAHFLINSLDLNGEGYALDAACASSLYAIKLACDELHDNNADLVLAGGVNASEDMFLHIGFHGMKALSQNGESNPFNIKATGLVPAQGCGFLVLKKLSQALADHDSIYAIIRGIGLSNDGNNGGLLMPAQKGQVLAMQRAYEVANLNPEEISFIDCHATGTTLGDGIEINSLREVFHDQELILSSLKSNIGHMLTASGIGSVIRTSLSLKNKILPPTRCVDELIPALKESNFKLLQHAKEWELTSGSVRRAGVNGFGMGGDNAHVILEEWVPEKKVTFSSTSTQRQKQNIAIIGLSVLTADTTNLNEFATLLFNEKKSTIPEVAYQRKDLDLPIAGMRFTPRDLSHTQGAQLAILTASLEAMKQMKQYDPARMNIIMGMQCDPSTVRFDLRWKLEELMLQHGYPIDTNWIEASKDKITSPIESADVLGAMPNVMASRVNIEFDCTGSSYSVSDEELSGTTALKLGIRDLQAYEADTIMVGAADFSVNELDKIILPAVLGNKQLILADMAVILILKRLDDAVRDGEHIYAVLSDKTVDVSDHLLMDQFTLHDRFGYSHAASGLFTVAASALCCAHRKKPVETLQTVLSVPMHATIHINSFSGKKEQIQLISYDHQMNLEDKQTELNDALEKKKTITYATHFPEIELPPFTESTKPCLFNRHDLEILASGAISSVFGDLFKQQDHFNRQVRMPEPPLLLADRVIRIDGEPGSLKSGTIWTETDVTSNAWYLHEGRMPAGIMVESGQADLLLASWLGVDFYNKSERIYRLLGCDLMYHGSLAKPGETLCYEIHLSQFAQHGDTRLMFFYYDCYVNRQLRMSVREGQAGFFSDEELKQSRGVIWSPESAKYTQNPRLDPPKKLTQYRRFTRQQIERFAQGDQFACFGKGFEYAQTHNHSPRIQSDRMLLLHEITDFDPVGGPAQRGYMRAIQQVSYDDWFFKGHFKNDPCMPGTLMAEVGMQLISFYLAALGYAIDKDGWRFEPAKEQKIPMRCRGQCVPTSKEVIYEIYIDELISEPYPTLYVELLATVDGLKAFHAHRFSVQLVPDYVLAKYAHLLHKDEHPMIARDQNGFLFDDNAMIAAAWGEPAHAFGEMMRDIPPTRKIPRLPGPPYLFMSRVRSISAPINQMQANTTLIAEYDVPANAWYFHENDKPVMPFAVLMEVALQPCGWLASYVGCPMQANIDLFFRNLDGVGTLYQEIDANIGTLTTIATLNSIAKLGDMILVNFNVQLMHDKTLLYEMKTGFGYFPEEAFVNQAGLPQKAEDLQVLNRQSNISVDLLARPEVYFNSTIQLANPMLLMIDRITGIWPHDEGQFLCQLRAEKTVNPAEWFFKAHFYRDPVQPGSLGCQALIQLLQFYMLDAKLHQEFKRPCFQPIASAEAVTWKYRGQVVPQNQLIVLTMDILKVERQERSVCVLATGSLWVDGKRIYQLDNLGMRIVESHYD